MYTAKLLALALVALPLFAQPQKLATAPDLIKLRRVCVDKFVGEETLVATGREIAAAGMFALKRFTITENCAKADATLKGAIIERAKKRVRGEGESMEFGKAVGALSANRSSAAAVVAGVAGGSGEQLYSAETGSSATVTLRLVNPDGDVLWAYTQDSSGGKSKGAVADAIERAVKQLDREIARSVQ